MNGRVAAALLRHAKHLTGVVSAREILLATCREMREVTGSFFAAGSYSAPGQAWDRGVQVVVPSASDELPQAARSALFAIRRRCAARRQALEIARLPDTDAIFEGIASVSPGSVPDSLLVIPIVHRTGRLLGEVTLAGARNPDGDSASLLVTELAGLAAGALENAQRLFFARRDQERLLLLAEASDEALWDWNLETGEYWWGGGIQKLLGTGGGTVRNVVDWKLERIHPDDVARVEASFQRALDSPSASAWREEYRFRRGDGSCLHVEDAGYFLRESQGRAYRVVGAVRDITTLKGLLQREQEARRDAESASRAKDEFLAMLGHELRNPLAPILTAIDLVRRRGVPEIEKERTIIERQARHMVRLVDDLLDVSRVARGKVELQKQRLDLSQVVAAAIEMARPLVEERKHRLEVEVSPGLSIDADPARLAQVISNLLANSAKYTEPRGRIRLTGVREGDEVVIVVADTGIGIDEEMLPRVFDMFTQERQAIDRAQGGLGLGLSIVRSLVRLHGGSVTANSRGRGFGSEFTIRLPLASARATTRSAGEGLRLTDVSANRRTRRILVVDDNRDAVELLADHLIAQGNEVFVAHDGPSAIRLAAEVGPEVVLLDVGLPILDGYAVASAIRKGNGGASRRLVAITGYGQAGDRRRAFEAGFDAFLVKPVSLSRVDETIDELASTARPVLRRV